MKTRTCKMLSLIILFITFACSGNDTAVIKKTEILWDSWGVPHIFAKNATELFYAHGWTQMECHGDLILRLYGHARGKAAEYWGEQYLESDQYINTLGIPERAHEWSKEQTPEMKEYIEAFVKGMNDFTRDNGSTITDDVKMVLPIRTEDIMAHIQRIFQLAFVGGAIGPMAHMWGSMGSNGWAIAPSHSESGNAMLLTNPHLPWSDFFLFHEAHLVIPGMNAYGVTLVGIPTLAIAFNDHLGWTQTSNPFDGMDLYELTIDSNGYKLDNEILQFDTRTVTLKIRQRDGSFKNKKLTIRHSIHGPVIAEKEGKALAVRMVGLDRPNIFKLYWDLMNASNLQEFERALKDMQSPANNFIYADKEGHIMYLFSGCVPKRPKGDWYFWQGFIPGDTSETLWTDFHPYSDLPRIVDPQTGWIQNTNDPPWTATYPMQLNPADFPGYITSPRMDTAFPGVGTPFRPQRSIRMISEDDRISFEELKEYKHSTRMELADRILDDLMTAVHQHGSERAKDALSVLERWDRKADNGSRGSVLFITWLQELGYYNPNPPFGSVDLSMFAQVWDDKNPLTTPDGLKDPERAAKALDIAANKLLEKYSSIDVAWGDVFRFRYNGKDFPGNGGPDQLGIFRNMLYIPEEDGKHRAVTGDTYVAIIEFSDPIKAEALLSYGNSSQPDSPHKGDQLKLLSEKKLRPVLRTREEIEANLEKIDEF